MVRYKKHRSTRPPCGAGIFLTTQFVAAIFPRPHEPIFQHFVIFTRFDAKPYFGIPRTFSSKVMNSNWDNGWIATITCWTLVPWYRHFSQNLNYGAGIFLFLIHVAHPFFISAKEHYVFFKPIWQTYFPHVWSTEQKMAPCIDAHINRLQPDSLILILSLTSNIWHAFS